MLYNIRLCTAESNSAHRTHHNLKKSSQRYLSEDLLSIRFFLWWALQENRFLLTNCRPVLWFLVQTICRAHTYTYAAIHAGKWITGPGAAFFVHRDALGRAFECTNAAECTFFDFVIELAPGAVKGRPYLTGVSSRGPP